jgi:methylenetetrahydrofolate--tRNA-(uracil-5-)-methyltransferase
MKPLGLETPDGVMPYAVVQLRRENLAGDSYNLVGFQTRLNYKEQLRVFRLLPGLQEANFFHLGSVHRNTFLHVKNVCSPALSCLKYPELYFAGQMTGVEGYTESAASGLFVALQVWRDLQGLDPAIFPNETAIGALNHYLFTAAKPVPSNINMGLMPPLEKTFIPKEVRRERRLIKAWKREKIVERAQMAFNDFQGTYL